MNIQVTHVTYVLLCFKWWYFIPEKDQAQKFSAAYFAKFIFWLSNYAFTFQQQKKAAIFTKFNIKGHFPVKFADFFLSCRRLWLVQNFLSKKYEILQIIQALFLSVVISWISYEMTIMLIR